eukprot:Sspe_Gene.20809::Locus_7673_Transcript_1_1_Confidence_1.000_Length_1820::g.20809::m.20809
MAHQPAQSTLTMVELAKLIQRQLLDTAELQVAEREHQHRNAVLQKELGERFQRMLNGHRTRERVQTRSAYQDREADTSFQLSSGSYSLTPSYPTQTTHASHHASTVYRTHSDGVFVEGDDDHLADEVVLPTPSPHARRGVGSTHFHLHISPQRASPSPRQQVFTEPHRAAYLSTPSMTASSQRPSHDTMVGSVPQMWGGAPHDVPWRGEVDPPRHGDSVRTPQTSSKDTSVPDVAKAQRALESACITRSGQMRSAVTHLNSLPIARAALQQHTRWVAAIHALSAASLTVAVAGLAAPFSPPSPDDPVLDIPYEAWEPSKPDSSALEKELAAVGLFSPPTASPPPRSIPTPPAYHPPPLEPDTPHPTPPKADAVSGMSMSSSTPRASAPRRNSSPARSSPVGRFEELERGFNQFVNGANEMPKKPADGKESVVRAPRRLSVDSKQPRMTRSATLRQEATKKAGVKPAPSPKEARVARAMTSPGKLSPDGRSKGQGFRPPYPVTMPPSPRSPSPDEVPWAPLHPPAMVQPVSAPVRESQPPIRTPSPPRRTGGKKLRSTSEIAIPEPYSP